MIETNEAIVQDQLLPSSVPGKVRVIYPRGSQTLYAAGADGVRITDPNETSLAKDGAWQQAILVNGGSGVLFLSDTPTSLPTILLGANLKAL